MLESLHLRNFKSLRNVRLTGLQPLTVLVGPNGVGKTSALQAVERLCAFAPPAGSDNPSEPARSVFVGRWAPERIVTRGQKEWEIAIVYGGSPYRITARWDPARFEGSYRFEVEASGRHLSLTDAADRERHLFFREGPIRHLPQVALLKLDARVLGEPSRAQMKPGLGSDGAGLASMLAYLAGAHRDRMSVIEGHLKAIVGITGQIRTLPAEMAVEDREMIRIDDTQVPRTTRRVVPGHRLEVDIDDLGPVPGDLLSEGTLTTLALLAVLSQPDGPRLILLDDIDQGLHPRAQKGLIDALRSLLAERPGVQIICTSHSPYLLDHFAPEEVQVMSLGPGSAVSAARLDHHPDWPEWKGMVQTGEFWQSVGESWVTEDAVAKASETDG